VQWRNYFHVGSCLGPLILIPFLNVKIICLSLKSFIAVNVAGIPLARICVNVLVILHVVFFLHSRNLLLTFQKDLLEVCVLYYYLVLCLQELNIVIASKKFSS
jgi:hypothetical protein